MVKYLPNQIYSYILHHYKMHEAKWCTPNYSHYLNIWKVKAGIVNVRSLKPLIWLLLILSTKFKYQLFLLYAQLNFIWMPIKWKKKIYNIENLIHMNNLFCICYVVIVMHSWGITSLMAFLSRIDTFISII